MTDPGVILKLFNAVLNTSEIIPDWVKGTIVPIHKKGAKSDPTNYRGITLMSCLSKLFLNIIQNRLSKFTLENNIFHKAQLGFLKGNRTSDAHVILHNLISKVCHKSNAKIFSCFVDFSSAFDTVQRDLFLKKCHLTI